MDGHKHVPFLNVKANKIIIQVQMNQKIGWHTRYDLDLEVFVVIRKHLTLVMVVYKRAIFKKLWLDMKQISSILHFRCIANNMNIANDH